MERIKQLHYDGQYGEDEYSLPKLKIEDVPTKRRRTLSHKYLCNVTEDEFEEWLAVKLNSDLRELSYNLIMILSQLKRSIQKIKKHMLITIEQNIITSKSSQNGRKRICFHS